MSRATFTALGLALATALAPVGSAAAQDCMCLVPGQLPASWLAEAQASPHLPQSALSEQSVEVGPVFSSDGELLVSDTLADELRGDALRADDGEPRPAPAAVLWCVSSDDPRCAPRDEAPNDGPRAFDASHGASTSMDHVRLPRTAPARANLTHRVGAPRAGERSRVERPPRS